MTSTSEHQSINQEQSEAFAGRMLDLVNGAFVAIGLSVGHRTGLFDTLATLPPSTSEEIATATGLNERYVREWLRAMTLGRIIEYDAASRRYRLPAEHASSLTRAAGFDNMAHLAQFIALLAEVESEVVRCFREGGGVGYEHYPRFARLMREDSANVFDALLIDTILPLVPGLPSRLQAGANLADVGCGAGHAINLMAREFPASRFTGYDFSDEAIAIARAEAADWGLTNAHFEVRDVAELDADDAFDVVTAFDAIHDQAWPRKVLAAIHRALRPGGTFLMVDTAGSSNVEDNFDLPLGPFAYSVSYLHCMTVSLAYGGEGLGTMWGEQQALDLLREAGFTGTVIEQVKGDLFNNYYISRKEPR